MKKATLFHRASGAVLAALSGPDDADFAPYETPDVGVFPGELDKAEFYVADGSPALAVTRTPVTLSIPTRATLNASLTLTGLPDPCWIRVDGELHLVTGGAITRTPQVAREITVELVGAYTGEATCLIETECGATLTDDARWQALLAATPQQIENWLAANCTNLAEARVVLKLLLLAVRSLGR